MIKLISNMYIIFIIIHISISATGQKVEYIDDELTINSSCLIHDTRQKGKCININDCPSALSAIPKIYPQTCFLENRIPVVCCPIDKKIYKKHIDRNFSKSKIVNMCYNYYDDKITNIKRCYPYDDTDCFQNICSVPYASFGVRVSVLEHMYTATLGWKHDNDGYDFRCGAFLIARNFVLTAAHCMLGGNPEIVRLGDKVFKPNISQDVNVASVYNHPDYNPFIAYNDIAIVKLEKEADKQFILACLWMDDANLAPNLMATGFGATEFAGSNSDDLYKVSLTLMNNTVCMQEFSGDSRTPNGIISSQLCAGDPERRMDTCQGDSGGPLFTTISLVIRGDCKELGGIAHVLGITSYGQVCGQSLAGVYTRVSSYLDWIDSIIFGN